MAIGLFFNNYLMGYVGSNSVGSMAASEKQLNNSFYYRFLTGKMVDEDKY